MLKAFGRIHKPFTIARWQDARRFQDMSFLNWTLSPTGTLLIDKTSTKWDSLDITEDERSVIMTRLRLLVPHKALQQYSSANGEWNYTKLASVQFLTIMEDLLDDEYFWPDIWRTFNNTLPMHSRYNHESWKINSIEMERPASRKPNERNKPSFGKQEYQQPPNEAGQNPTRGRQNFRPRGRGNYSDRGRGAGQNQNQRPFQNQQQHQQQHQQSQQQQSQQQQGYNNKPSTGNRNQYNQNPYNQTQQQNYQRDYNQQQQNRQYDNRPQNSTRGGPSRGSYNGRFQGNRRGNFNRGGQQRRVHNVQQDDQYGHSQNNLYSSNYNSDQGFQQYALPTPLQQQQRGNSQMNQPQQPYQQQRQNLQGPQYLSQANAKNAQPPPTAPRTMGVGVIQQAYGNSNQ